MALVRAGPCNPDTLSFLSGVQVQRQSDWYRLYDELACNVLVSWPRSWFSNHHMALCIVWLDAYRRLVPAAKRPVLPDPATFRLPALDTAVTDDEDWLFPVAGARDVARAMVQALHATAGQAVLDAATLPAALPDQDQRVVGTAARWLQRTVLLEQGQFDAVVDTERWRMARVWQLCRDPALAVAGPGLRPEVAANDFHDSDPSGGSDDSVERFIARVWRPRWTSHVLPHADPLVLIIFLWRVVRQTYGDVRYEQNMVLPPWDRLVAELRRPATAKAAALEQLPMTVWATVQGDTLFVGAYGFPGGPVIATGRCCTCPFNAAEPCPADGVAAVAHVAAALLPWGRLNS
jgi:hypothetical protein